MSVVAQRRISPEPVFAGQNFIKTDNNILSKSPSNSFRDKAQSIAEWVCSRESTYRSALDLVGWELPTLLAASTRNIYSFAEAVFMSVMGFSAMVAAPNITKLMGSLLSRFYLNQEDQDAVKHYLLFQLKDLDNKSTVKKGIERMKLEEPEDCSFLADLNKEKPQKIEYYNNKAQEITKFFSDLEITEKKREQIKALKKAVILGESFVESFIWGGYYFFNRMFRKHVLKQDRFTGTKAYESDEEAKKK